jgi:hypothetical protein
VTSGFRRAGEPVDAAGAARAGPLPGRDRVPMVMALVVWLCSLPFVLVLLVPWLGLATAATIALALLAGITVVCWAMCAWTAPRCEHDRR